jgi:DnaK suppressor protein
MRVIPPVVDRGADSLLKGAAFSCLSAVRGGAFPTAYPVIGGFVVNKKDLNKFKKKLEESRQQLLQSARKTLAEETILDTDDLPDEIDLASSEYAQSMVFRLRDREKYLLAKIEKALERIDDGSFGICESCGESINVKRLEARPVTTLCIRCKEEQEKVEKSFG